MNRKDVIKETGNLRQAIGPFTKIPLKPVKTCSEQYRGRESQAPFKVMSKSKMVPFKKSAHDYQG